MCGGSSKFSPFQIDCLDAHNDYRARHRVAPLDLNYDLCKYAEEHAKFMSTCDNQSSSKSPYGESIYIKKSSRKIIPDGFEPVQEWYGEIKNYKEECKYPRKDIKHFVNVVWKETQMMGVGHAFNPEKNILYVVANYYPRGNVFKTFGLNVKPVRLPKKDCSKVKVI